MANDSPKKAIEAIDPVTGKATDAFGDNVQNVLGHRVQRGSTVNVRVRVDYDDGHPTAEQFAQCATLHDRVQLVQVQRAKRGHYVVVSVMSQVKKGHEKNATLPFDAGNATDMRRRVNIAAGGLAEMLCEKYGDRMDPGEVAQAANEAWDGVLEALQALPG